MSAFKSNRFDWASIQLVFFTFNQKVRGSIHTGRDTDVLQHLILNAVSVG